MASAKLIPAALLVALACTSPDEETAYLESFPIEDYEIAVVPGVGRFYVDDNPAHVKAALRNGRPWEPETIAQLQKHIVPGSTVVDVGAHIGSLTVPMARFAGPSGQVYSFEPQRKIHRELVHNLRLNELSNVKPLRIAVGADFGVVEMNPVKKQDGQVRVGAGGIGSSLRPLDSFELENVSVIKIDVEGFQAEVLKGAVKTIARWKPVLIVEIFKTARQETFRLLEQFGYRWKRAGVNYVAVPNSVRLDDSGTNEVEPATGGGPHDDAT